MKQMSKQMGKKHELQQIQGVALALLVRNFIERIYNTESFTHYMTYCKQNVLMENLCHTWVLLKLILNRMVYPSTMLRLAFSHCARYNIQFKDANTGRDKHTEASDRQLQRKLWRKICTNCCFVYALVSSIQVNGISRKNNEEKQQQISNCKISGKL